MGARLVKQAVVYAIDVPLNPNEYRLLIYMALTALDEDKVPRYFDSRESSALALGRRVADDGAGTPVEQKARAAAFEAVKVAIRGLIALGAISRIKTGRVGQRSEYALLLNPLTSRTSPEFIKRRRGEGSPFREGKDHPSVTGRLTLPREEDSPFPQGTTQEPLGTTAGTTSPNAGTSLAAVEKVRAIS